MTEESLYPILPLGGEFPKSAIRGAVGTLRVLPVSALRVDDTFQRAVSTGSARNIRRICADFNWSKFLPVIVVEQGEVYSIIDGQHRTIAAATLGINAVPCYVLACGPREAAAAFAAINGNVTPVGPVDVWFAELKAGGEEAVSLQGALDAAGVRVVRKKDGMAVGETRSINVLRRAFDRFGRDLLITVLQCITETGSGNPGMINGAVVNGIGSAIRSKTELLNNPSALFNVFDRIDLPAMLDAAQRESVTSGNPVQFIMTRRINAALRESGRKTA